MSPARRWRLVRSHLVLACLALFVAIATLAHHPTACGVAIAAAFVGIVSALLTIEKGNHDRA